MARFSLALLATAAFALLTSSALGQGQAQQQVQDQGQARAAHYSLREQLVGSWSLVSFEVMLPGGGTRQNFGPNPKGIVIFDASGRYTTIVSRPDRPRTGATTEGFAANFGTWTINEAERTVVRRVEAALDPSNEGSETKSMVERG
jgi:hypothetical protein